MLYELSRRGRIGWCWQEFSTVARLFREHFSIFCALSLVLQDDVQLFCFRLLFIV